MTERTFGSVCSGILAPEVAWVPLGWRPVFASEVAAFPSAVIAHRFPHLPNLGDMRHVRPAVGSLSVLVGGTPCQSFSVAGLRKGLADPRGNLALEFLRIADAARPDWMVWENVPGVLSSGGGRDFGAFLGALGQLGYGWAYRVLDAQHFGVPQRRRRVFVVASARGWAPAAAVLLERASLRRNPAPGRETGAGATAPAARCLTAHAGRYDLDTETFVTHTLRGEGFDASEDGTGRGTPLVPVAFHHTQDPISSSVSPCLGANADGMGLSDGAAVRRLTPRECERLQGFPDDWTRVPYRGREAADGPRYQALGNSMAVPVMAWIGRRLDAVEAALAAGEEVAA